MAPSLEDIRTTRDDEQLYKLLSAYLEELFPPEQQEDRDRILVALANSPRGMRAMAGTYDLDVSMAVDDLAWHFGNHNDDRFLEETVTSLKELEAPEVAEIFLSAWEIVKPYLPEIRSRNWERKDFSEYLERTGIQSRTEPLSRRMWAIRKECGDLGFMRFWVDYARKYPERCVRIS